MGKAGRLRNQRCKAENLGGQRSKEDRIKRKKKIKVGGKGRVSQVVLQMVGSRFEDMEGVILIQCEEIANEQWSILWQGLWKVTRYAHLCLFTHVSMMLRA